MQIINGLRSQIHGLPQYLQPYSVFGALHSYYIRYNIIMYLLSNFVCQVYQCISILPTNLPKRRNFKISNNGLCD